jgi:hypothetical protein
VKKGEKAKQQEIIRVSFFGISGYGLVLDMFEQSSAGDDRQMSSFRLEIYLNKLTNRQCHTQ